MKLERKKGFALIEVVFAFAILELAILAIIGAFPFITRMNKRAWNSTIATQLAQEKMEEIIAQKRFIWSTGTVGGLNDEQLITQAQLQGQKDNPFELSEGVRIWWGEQDPEGDSNIQVVRVKVFWTEGGKTHSITLMCQNYI